MATSVTSSFWLSETVQITNGTASGGRVQGTFDLGAYISVGDSMAVAVEQFDMILQNGSDYGNDLANCVNGNAAISCQLTELNPGGLFVRADNTSLAASAAVNIDFTNNIGSMEADIFPDTFGKKDQSRIIINDTLYVVVGVDGSGSSATKHVWVTARIKVRLITLNKKDWMSKAIEAFGSDS